MEIEDLHTLLSLDRDTGKLYWKARQLSDFKECRAQKAQFVRWQAERTGREALVGISRGYKRGRILGVQYLAHRVVWAMHHGFWPKHGIDHINGIKTDNRPINLRDVPQSENAKNTAKSKLNTSGCSGVSWDADRRKWAATIRINGRQVRLGLHEKKEDAITARKSAEKKAGYHRNHGRSTTCLRAI